MKTIVLKTILWTYIFLLGCTNAYCGLIQNSSLAPLSQSTTSDLFSSCIMNWYNRLSVMLIEYNFNEIYDDQDDFMMSEDLKRLIYSQDTDNSSNELPISNEQKSAFKKILQDLSISEFIPEEHIIPCIQLYLQLNESMKSDNPKKVAVDLKIKKDILLMLSALVLKECAPDGNVEKLAFSLHIPLEDILKVFTGGFALYRNSEEINSGELNRESFLSKAALLIFHLETTINKYSLPEGEEEKVAEVSLREIRSIAEKISFPLTAKYKNGCTLDEQHSISVFEIDPDTKFFQHLDKLLPSELSLEYKNPQWFYLEKRNEKTNEIDYNYFFKQTFPKKEHQFNQGDMAFIELWHLHEADNDSNEMEEFVKIAPNIIYPLIDDNSVVKFPQTLTVELHNYSIPSFTILNKSPGKKGKGILYLSFKNQNPDNSRHEINAKSA